MVVTVVVGALALRDRAGGAGSASPSPGPSTTAAATLRTGPPTFDASPPEPMVSDLGHPLLGVTGGWELFARADTEVVRIQFARGRVTHTPVPALNSSGPVYFVVGRDWAVVRPLDFVPGFLIPDGRPARALAGVLGRSGPALPGPDPATLWVAAGSGVTATMVLARPDGRPVGRSVRMPSDTNDFPRSDGTGHLVLQGIDGFYLARPDGMRRITTGALLAVGPTSWLVRECDERHRCAVIAIDRNTGVRRALDVGISLGLGYPSPGVIAPGGGAAALFERGPDGLNSLHLLDLVSGADRRLEVPVDQPGGGAGLAWSPDGRWLFVAGEHGQLFAVDASTGRVRGVGVELPPIHQLAIRAS
ncbi:hypothetical protein AB0H57_28840 [Micromonospora sp. NPDC050686]|uniref:hypothetical protein n=1 Tax=Micromonospora sp. NPDC050686 TaxID=3154631 RepID=UPI0033E8CC66